MPPIPFGPTAAFAPFAPAPAQLIPTATLTHGAPPVTPRHTFHAAYPPILYWPYPSPPVSPTSYYGGPMPPVPPVPQPPHLTSWSLDYLNSGQPNIHNITTNAGLHSAAA
ncbi:hypothetical protein R5R35_003371 [Gryllus longicercus]|uniref:Uncharacterized protein n=1 Tax=Gryllus longicercus TaxID=2509291 RepID=A0AAN9ZC16_9ORTH